MTAKNLVKAIILGTALALGGNVYTQTKNPEVIATFEYTSHRPEKEYNGKTYQYNILSDGTICQADKPNVKFAQTWFYDVDGDDKFTEVDLTAHKEGKLVYMHPDFNKKANIETKKILENMVQKMKVESNNYTNSFTDAEKDYNSNGKTDSLENQPSREISEGIRGYYSQKDLGLKENNYKTKLDESIISKEKVKPVWSLIVGANVNSDFDKYGLSLGARVNPFKNEKIGLGLTADVGFGLDKEIDSQRISLSRGKEFVGKINEIDNRSFGLSAEMQLYNFIVGGGFDYSKHISETNEKVIKGEEVLESNTNSVSEGKVYGKGYIGLEFQPTEKFGVGATVGYHGRDGLNIGIRTKLKLNKRR
ncbi:hypothetical protein M0R72_04145 [Candidatus Pacearchaeota archaeon]|jgi:hypothetical protein|nr:hypothetical protein [Candidatus Pacearchaeota archaeon]